MRRRERAITHLTTFLHIIATFESPTLDAPSSLNLLRLAERFEFVSSPTVRVNGGDICPEVIENECDCCRSLSDYDVYCHQFDFNDKLYKVPPVAYVVKRILEIVFQGERPEYDTYEMPENIRGFLRGKEAKQARKAQKAAKKAKKAAKKSSSGNCCC